MDQAFLKLPTDQVHKDQLLAEPMAGHPSAQDTRRALPPAPRRPLARASGIFEAETRVMPGLEAAPARSHIEDTMFTVIRGIDAGKSFAFHQPRLIIGRTGPCEIQLRDDSVSRAHLIVDVEDGQCFVHDGASRNGTRVNNTRLEGKRRLYDGDLIQIGESLLRYHEKSSETERTSAGSLRALAGTPLPEKPERDGAAGSGPWARTNDSRRSKRAGFPELRYACTTLSDPGNSPSEHDTLTPDEATDTSVVSGSFTCRPFPATMELPARAETRWLPSALPVPVIATPRGASSPSTARVGRYALMGLLALLAFCLLARHYSQEDKTSQELSSEGKVDSVQDAVDSMRGAVDSTRGAVDSTRRATAPEPIVTPL